MLDVEHLFDVNQILALVIGIVTVTVQYLAGLKIIAAWWLALGGNAVWYWYVFETATWMFLPLVIVMTWVYVRNLRRWRAESARGFDRGDGGLRYRARPVEIEARQWDGTAEAATPIIDWVLGCGGTARYGSVGSQGDTRVGGHVLEIDTLEGKMYARPGWFVVRGTAGEFYGCEPKIFDVKYEPLAEVEQHG